MSWLDSLTQQLQNPASLHQTAPVNIPRRKHSSGDAPHSSYSVSPPRSALAVAASHHTKRVNSEMRDLYMKRKLTPDAKLSTTQGTVGEYLLEKWIASQKLPGAGASGSGCASGGGSGCASGLSQSAGGTFSAFK